MDIFDIIIVGGGPSSLALAQACSSIGKSILIIESESSIGGCHRVRRVPYRNKYNVTEYLFTEHGPRVYGSTYKTFIELLKDINLSFFDLFTPYNFSIGEIGGETVWSTLNIREFIILTIAFLKVVFSDYGKNISVYDFSKSNNFSESSIDIMDRICRLTDGADSSNYTLSQFLELVNQHAFYQLYQPNTPNDIGLFKLWSTALVKRGVQFKLNTKIKNIIQQNNKVSYVVSEDNTKYYAKNFIIATPPKNLVDILKNSDKILQNAFGNFEHISNWSDKTKYIDYISATFHWDVNLNLEKIYGFPKTEWGIAFIVLSDYMSFQENSSKTVISAAITITNVKSNSSKRYPHECSSQDLLHEIYIQLKQSYPNLPVPTSSLLSPGVVFDQTQNHWVSKDTAFISTTNQPFLYPKSPFIDNLYTLGTHNGTHLYSFTSIEAAVTNGISLSHILYPELINKFKITRGYHVSDLFLICIIIVLIYIIHVK